MTESSPKVIVIIPNWNGHQWLARCLKGLYEQEFKDFETVLVDNGSTDGSLTLVKQNYPQVRLIIFGENRGFAAAVNAGIKASRCEYVVLLNTDTYARPGWLSNLVKVMNQSSLEVGSLASKMIDLSKPDVIENAGDILSWHGVATKRGHGQPTEEFTRLEEIFSPCAGAALYRRSFLEQLSGFDEHFFAYLEDVDLGLRGRLLGYKCLFVPSAEILHLGHGSHLPHYLYVRLMTRNRLLLFLKNVPWILLLKNFFLFFYGQMYFLITYKRPLSSLAGYLSIIPLIPYILKERWTIKNKSKLSLKEFDNLLVKKFNMPSLSEMILNRIKSFWK